MINIYDIGIPLIYEQQPPIVEQNVYLSLPDNPHYIAVVGESCSGKTYLTQKAMQEAGVAEVCDPATRALERDWRPGDSYAENRMWSVDPTHDVPAVRRNGYTIETVKPAANKSVEMYYFDITNSDKVPVIPANLGFIQRPNNVFPFIVPETIVIGVFAPQEVREQRLGSRNPELFKSRPEDASHRLSDLSKLVLERSHFVLHNYEDNEKGAPAAMAGLLIEISNGMSPVEKPSYAPATPDIHSGYSVTSEKQVSDNLLRQLSGVESFTEYLKSLAQKGEGDEGDTRTLDNYLGIYSHLLSNPITKDILEQSGASMQFTELLQAAMHAGLTREPLQQLGTSSGQED